MPTGSASNRSYWQNHVNACEDGELSKAAYCREQAINYHQFMYWVKRFRQKKTGLVPVALALPATQPTGTHDLCHIVLSNGHQIVIHDKSMLPLLKQLVSALQ